MRYFITCDVGFGYEVYMDNFHCRVASPYYWNSLESAEKFVTEHLKRLPWHHKHPRIYNENNILISGPAPDEKSMSHLRNINTPGAPSTEPE